MPGDREFDLCLGGMGKIEPEVSGFNSKRTGADDDFSLVGFDRQMQQWGGAFEHHFGLRGRNLNDPIFKSSNVRVLYPA